MNDPFSPAESTAESTADSSVHRNMQSARDHVRQAADELRAATAAKAQQFRDAAEDRAHRVKGIAESGWEDAKVKAQDFMAETEDYVRTNPTKSVLTALGVGFVLGLLFRR